MEENKVFDGSENINGDNNVMVETTNTEHKSNFELLRERYKEKSQKISNKNLFKKFIKEAETVEKKLEVLDKAIALEETISTLENQELKTNIDKFLNSINTLEEVELEVKKIKKSEDVLGKVKQDITKTKMILNSIKKDEKEWVPISHKNISRLTKALAEITDKEAEVFDFDVAWAKQVLKDKMEEYTENSKVIRDIITEKKELVKEKQIFDQKMKTLRDQEEELVRQWERAEKTLKEKIENKKRELKEQNDILEAKIKMNNELFVKNAKEINDLRNTIKVFKDFESKDLSAIDKETETLLKITKTEVWKNVLEFIKSNDKKEKTKFEQISEKINTWELLSEKEIEFYDNNKAIIDSLRYTTQDNSKRKQEADIAEIKLKIEQEAVKTQILNDEITSKTFEAIKWVEEDLVERVKIAAQELDERTSKVVENVISRKKQENKTIWEKTSEYIKTIKEAWIEWVYEKEFEISAEKVKAEFRKKQIEIEEEERLKKEEEESITIDNVEEKLNSKENLNKKRLNRQIWLATDNINSAIIKINKEIKEEEKKWDKWDINKLKELFLKKESYIDLKEKLEDKEVSDWEKEGLIWILWNSDFLKDYIALRKDSVKINKWYVERELAKNKDTKVSELDEQFYSKLFKNSVNEEKYTLIEKFSKLRNEIPWFSNVWLDSNIVAVAQQLGINDEATQEKISELVKLQENIKNFSLSTYTNSFVQKVAEKKMAVESEIIQLQNVKDVELNKIDRVEWLTEASKQQMKNSFLNNYEKQIVELSKNKEILNSEIDKIEKFWLSHWRFDKEELKQLSENLKLFGVVSDFEKYGNLISWISDDIISGKTEYIDFKTLSNTSWDLYTTVKVKEILNSQLETVEETLELIKTSKNPKDIELRNKLTREKIQYEKYLNKIEIWILWDKEVKEVLSLGNLYKAKVNRENLDLLTERNKLSENLLKATTPEEQEILKWKIEEIDRVLSEQSNSYREWKEKKTNRIKELKKLYREAKSKEEQEQINSEIARIEWEVTPENKNWLYSIFGIDKHAVNLELEDWYDALWVAEKNRERQERIDKAKWYMWAVKWMLFDKDDIHYEDKERAKIRNAMLEYNLRNLFDAWVSWALTWVFKILRLITEKIQNIGVVISRIREVLEKNRLEIFVFTTIFIFIITLTAGKNSFNFLWLNTHLFSLWDYSTNSDGVLIFAWSDESTWDMWLLGQIYYKTNILILFLYFMVLYQIIIEFLYKYLEILKNPTLWIEIFLRRAGKFLVFFLMLGLTFRVASII